MRNSHSQPFWRHAILLPELLVAGKPVFIEKPLASTIQAGEAVLDAVRKSGTWMMLGYHKRSDPACAYAKERVEELRASGEAEPLRYVRILMAAGDWTVGGFTERIDEGDPVPDLEREPCAEDMDEPTFNAYVGFVNSHIHQVNLLRFFLGENYEITYADPSGVMLAGVSESGVGCVIEMSPYRTTLDWQESVLVAFETGYVKVDLPAPLALNRPGRVEVLRDRGEEAPAEVSRPILPWVHAMRQQAANFVAAVKGERPPTCGPEEALEDLKLARRYIKLWKGV